MIGQSSSFGRMISIIKQIDQSWVDHNPPRQIGLIHFDHYMIILMKP